MYDEMEAYYYQKLNKTGQAVYHAMKAGIEEIAPEIVMPKVSSEELADIFMMMRMDQPEIFWASGFRYKYYKDSPNLILVPEYLFEKAKIREHQKAMQSRVARLAREAQNLSEWEKEKFIHDFICENITYDKLKKPYSHEIIGPLGQGTGVCEGIAKSVKILCDALGIWCIIVLAGNNPEKGIRYRHTWNIVRIGGIFYHLDATFDNSLTKGIRDLEPGTDEIRYDYFNIDDRAVFRDHEPYVYPAEACSDHDHFFYKEKKKSFTKTEDVYKRSLQAAKKGKLLTFHWRGGYLTREILEELLGEIRRAGQEMNRDARISLNWPQSVVSVAYSAADPEQVVLENANEGETAN